MAASLDFKQMVTDFANDNPSVQALQFIRDDPEGVRVHHIDDQGMVNYVFKVNSADDKLSVIIKYSEQTMRLAPDEKISLERQLLEFNALKLVNSIQAGSVPEPYCLDRKHNMIAMEDMSSWELLSTQMERRVIDLEAASSLGHLLGRIHKETSRDLVTEQQWQDYLTQQTENKRYTRGVFFERSCDETDKMNIIPDDILQQYRTAVEEIKDLGFLKKIGGLFDLQLCFIHGDCHQKSIFIKNGKTAIFDLEFAFLGHLAANVSYPLVAYLLCYVFEKAHPAAQHSGPDAATFTEQCVQGMRTLLEAYLKTHTGVSQSNESQKAFVSTLVLFSGAVSFMAAVFRYLDQMVDLKKGDRALMLDIGTCIMKAHTQIHTVEQFLDLITAW